MFIIVFGGEYKPTECKMAPIFENKHDVSQWQNLNNILWRDRCGNIAFRINIYTPHLETQEAYRYITCIDCRFDRKPLKDIVDVETFKRVSGTYYKDKKNVYLYSDMFGGGWFAIVDGADSVSFESIDEEYSHYARDKHSIYAERFGRMDAVDYATFEIFSPIDVPERYKAIVKHNPVVYYAKDKNNYYNRNRVIKDYNDTDFLEIKEVLDEMYENQRARLP